MRSRRRAAVVALVCLVVGAMAMSARADGEPTLTLTASPSVVSTWQGPDSTGNTSTLTVTASNADTSPAADGTKVTLKITGPNSSGASLETAVGPDLGVEEIQVVLPDELEIEGREVDMPEQEVDLREDGVPASVTVPGAHVCCTPGQSVPLPGGQVSVGPAGVSIDDQNVATPTPFGPTLSSNELTLTGGTATATYAAGPAQAQDEIVATWVLETGESISATVTIQTCVDPTDDTTCNVDEPLPIDLLPCNPSSPFGCLPEDVQNAYNDAAALEACIETAEDPTTCLPQEVQDAYNEVGALEACIEAAEDPIVCLPEDVQNVYNDAAALEACIEAAEDPTTCLPE